MTKTNIALSSPFLLLLLLVFNPVIGRGQGTVQTPDCVILVNVTLTAQTTVTVPALPTVGGVGDNRTSACQDYTFQYQATGTGALTSVAFQTGQSANTTVTFNNFPGTVVTGINPNTSSTGAISTFSTGCTSMVGCTVANSWLQILITRGTFAGVINGVLYGYRTGYSGGGGGGGGGGGCTSPCPVEGVDAAGAAPTVPPVVTGGTDGSVVRRVLTDTSGRQEVVGAAASGATNAGNPVKIGGPFNTTQPTVTNGQAVDAQMTARGAQIVAPGVDGFPVTVSTNTPTPTGAATAQADGATNTPTVPTVTGPTAETVPTYMYRFNGATWDRNFVCPLSAPITFSSASGTLEFIALTSNQIIRICHISLSSTVATNITLVYGTGTNCGSGTTSLSGAYQNITTLALDFGSDGALRTAVSNAFCVTSSVSATVGGLVTYAKF